MSQTGVIIRRNSGVFVPNAYIELALKANPTAWGAAVVTDGELQISKGDGLDLELFQETMKTFEKQNITFYLCNSPSAINEDDLSPFTILSDDDKPLLVAFIEGKFPQYEKVGSSHPGEFFVANEYLIPKLQDMFDMTGGDIAKVMEAVKKPHFKKEMLLTAVPRGIITLVANTGESLTFAQADDAAEYSWGWVSQNLGYALAPPVERKEEEPKKKSMFGGKSTVREKAASVTNSDVVKVAATKTDAAVIKNYTKRKEKPGKMSRSMKKDWYKQRLGYLPEGWANDVEIEVHVDQTGKLLTYAEAKRLGITAVGLPKLENPPARTNPPGDGGKDTEADHVQPKHALPVQKKVSTEVLPLMSPTTRDHIKKIIGENSQVLHDPGQAQATEARFQDFCAQLGLPKGDYKVFGSWSDKMIFDLCREKPDGAHVFIRSLLSKVLYSETKAAPVEVKEDVAAPQKKKSMFGNKVAA